MTNLFFTFGLTIWELLLPKLVSELNLKTSKRQLQLFSTLYS